MSNFFKIGISVSGSFDLTEENFAELEKSGIEALEISLARENYDKIDYKKTLELSEKYNVSLWSYHLPFAPFTELDPSSLDSSLRNHTVEYFRELIKKGSDIGINKFVVHASGEPINDNERNERMKYSMQSLDLLAQCADSCNSTIAVEDLPRSCLGKNAEEIQTLISANNNLRVCFDTNHLLSSTPIDFLKSIGTKIVTLHVSDYDGINERHWLPGEGIIDWKNLISTLSEIGYCGVWMYEIGLKCPKTIIRERNLTFSDFRENALALFENKNPPIFSRPKENLGFWE